MRSTPSGCERCILRLKAFGAGAEADEQYRARLRHARLGYCAARAPSGHVAAGMPLAARVPVHRGADASALRFSVAAAANTANAPGALRIVVKGVLDLRAHGTAPAGPPCALAEIWKERGR